MSVTGPGPLDEFPVHQVSAPAGQPVSSDRNFYDRCYLNAHARDGGLFLILGLGYYPNLGVKDGFVVVRRGGAQTALHLSDAIDEDRMAQHVGPMRIEVARPLERLRVVVEQTEGIGLDLTWRGLFPPLWEDRHVMRTGHMVQLDALRFAQMGSWEGTLLLDGETITLTPDRWIGSRDRSWGIRPVGEAPPPGRPPEPAFGGMWWLYLPVAFDDHWILLAVQEEPDGFRTLNHCERVWTDGRREQLGWPQIEIEYVPGTRTQRSATITCALPDGKPLVLAVDALLDLPLTVGAGYGGDPDWGHGRWQGPGFVQRVSYDMTDPAVLGRTTIGLVDAVARVRCEGAEGWGLFEHGVIGRHERSGFTDWFDTA